LQYQVLQVRHQLSRLEEMMADLEWDELEEAIREHSTRIPPNSTTFFVHLLDAKTKTR
jgi:hypothetical protein